MGPDAVRTATKLFHPLWPLRPAGLLHHGLGRRLSLALKALGRPGRTSQGQGIRAPPLLLNHGRLPEAGTTLKEKTE